MAIRIVDGSPKKQTINVSINHREPNKEQMAVAVNEIKGEDRSMADLAKESGISTATLSRIVNKSYDRPLTQDILESLAKCAPKGCRYNLDALMEINGTPKKTDEFLKWDDRPPAKRQLKITRANVMSLHEKKMTTARASVVISLQATSAEAFQVGDDGDFRNLDYISKMTYATSGMSITYPNHKDMKWVFSVFDDAIVGAADDNAEQKVKAYIEKISYVFLQDAWDAASMRSYVFSVIFSEECFYSAFVELLRNAKFNNRISAILINPYEFKMLRKHEFGSKLYPVDAGHGVAGN